MQSKKFVRFFTSKTFKDIPGPKGKFLIGNAEEFTKKPFHEMQNDLVKEFGKIVKLETMGFKVVRKNNISYSLGSYIRP